MEFDMADEEEEKHEPGSEWGVSPVGKRVKLERRISHLVTVPKDQKLILKMLLRPQNYGIGRYDYSCHGTNWVISDSVLGEQSPIDVIHNSITQFDPKFHVQFKYKDFEALTGLINLEWTLKLKGANQGSMGSMKLVDLNGKGPYTYRVDHLHFHGPSEHKFDGVQYDLEAHIVHELVKCPADERIEDY